MPLLCVSEVNDVLECVDATRGWQRLKSGLKARGVSMDDVELFTVNLDKGVSG